MNFLLSIKEHTTSGEQVRISKLNELSSLILFSKGNPSIGILTILQHISISLAEAAGNRSFKRYLEMTILVDEDGSPFWREIG